MRLAADRPRPAALSSSAGPTPPPPPPPPPPGAGAPRPRAGLADPGGRRPDPAGEHPPQLVDDGRVATRRQPVDRRLRGEDLPDRCGGRRPPRLAPDSHELVEHLVDPVAC